MPRIVPLPGTGTPRARKRPGRDLASVLRSLTHTEPPRPTANVGHAPHMAYDPDHPCRAELARHLAPWARRIVGVDAFRGYYYTPASSRPEEFDPPEFE